MITVQLVKKCFQHTVDYLNATQIIKLCLRYDIDTHQHKTSFINNIILIIMDPSSEHGGRDQIIVCLSHLKLSLYGNLLRICSKALLIMFSELNS